jgi:hypothetical protein
MEKPGSSGSTENNVVNITACNIEGSSPNYDPIQQYEYLNPNGCYYGLKDEIESNSALIIGLCSGFIGLQIVGYIFACLLMRGGGN